MAGNFDDAPGRRMAYDADGTFSWKQLSINSGIITEISGGQPADMNDENANSVFGMTDATVTDRVGHIFPELREFDGFFYGFRTNGSTNQVQTSVDTTNGVDGTWVTQSSNTPSHNGTTYSTYRDGITSQAVSVVKGVRIQINQNTSSSGENFQTAHIYGVISPGETPDRILFLDTENSDAVFTKVLDFAEVPRGQTTTRTFKVKNNSASLSINTIQITAEDLYLNAGDWYEFGEAGGPYQATYAIGNLANGAEELIELQQVIPDGETLGVQAGRIKVSHASVT